jgi:hypothetical protein
MLCFTNQILLFILICLDLLTIVKSGNLIVSLNLESAYGRICKYTMETTDTVVPKVNCQSLIIIGKSLGASNQIKQRQRKAWRIPLPTNLTR